MARPSATWRTGRRQPAAQSRRKNVTCVMGIAPSGIVEPLVFEGALDGVILTTWMRDRLLPQLQPGTTIVLDNLSVHKTAAARAAVEQAGCTIALSPRLLPRLSTRPSLANAKLKAYLRGVGARAFDPLVDAIGEGLTRITTQDAHAFRHHCGLRGASIMTTSKKPL
ncbi:MAG: transposase [Thermomicrobiales bacterium]